MYAGKKLRQLRLKLDINQEEMADSLGLSRSYYSAVELGKRKITKKMIEKITNKWKIDEEYFADKPNSETPTKLGGLIGGLNVGNKLIDAEFIKRADISSDKLKKVLKAIENEYPELDKLNKDIGYLFDFQYFIGEFFSEYLNNYWKVELPSVYNEPEHFNYESFKAKKIKMLKSFIHFKPILDNMSNAITQFYGDLKPFDTKGLIDDDFDKNP